MWKWSNVMSLGSHLRMYKTEIQLGIRHFQIKNPQIRLEAWDTNLKQKKMPIVPIVKNNYHVSDSNMVALWRRPF